ncbi:MAG: glycosyltransferase [Bacteroidales bacterium]
MKTEPLILVAPLDWGLGHATRTAALIMKLQQMHVQIVIAADGEARRYLRRVFPELHFLKLPFYRVRYFRHIPLWMGILVQLPVICGSIVREHFILRRAVKKLGVDIVISDNRFGCWNRNCYSIYLTHQVTVCLPRWMRILEYPLTRLHRHIISRYDQCWIPDFESEPNLSGKLSHRLPLPPHASFIGPLSALAGSPYTPAASEDIVLFVLSGPEPQRSVFEGQVFREIASFPQKKKIVVVRGSAHPMKKPVPGSGNNIQVFDLLPARDLKKIIEKAGLVICRAGYSSVMDLVILKKQGVLVPTPGQTEQEYLSRHLKETGAFFSMPQKHFSLERALQKASFFSPGIFREKPGNEWEEKLKQIVSQKQRGQHKSQS